MTHIEYESRHNRSPKMHLTNRGKMVVGGTVLAAASLLGAHVKATHDANNVHKHLPACDIPAQPGSGLGVDAVTHDVEKLGGRVDYGEVSVIAADGHKKKHGIDPITPDGSLIVDDNDQIRFSHLEPGVCYNAGGHAEGLVVKQDQTDK